MTSLAGTGETKATQLLPPPPMVDLEASFSLYQPTEEDTTSLSEFLTTYPEHQHIAPGKVLRFLRARKYKPDQANDMLNNHLEWCRKWLPNQVKQEDVNEKAMLSGCWRYLGKGSHGYPVAWVQTKYWNPHDYSKDEYETYVAYFSAMLERQMTSQTQHVIVFDMSGWAIWHGSYLSYIKRLIDIAQNQYPERLFRVLMINSPFLFRASWVVIKPWLDPVTASKVVFVSGVEQITKEFDDIEFPRERLITRYGGTIEDEDTILIPGFPSTELLDEETENTTTCTL